ncbi:hypothetical protein Ae201684_008974 [Aphanomyces euteiches]|uniref:Uncharacterized protein n=1 Tax=Aphanomyces euteiches TaxID=100861 RepID=A0A6G0X3A9_9STRA|nr:hypothetical protein Ae201684_008974 [Aphanomyces euteiches]
MVDQLDVATRARQSDFSLQKISRLLLDTDLALLVEGISQIKQEQSTVKETRRYSLAQHTTFVHLLGALTHIRQTLQSNAKVSMYVAVSRYRLTYVRNLIRLLGHTIVLHEAPATKLFPTKRNRAELLFHFLYDCDVQGMLSFFVEAISSPENKSVLLRTLILLRDLALALTRQGTCPSDSVWLLLLNKAHELARTHSVYEESSKQAAPTKLSLAAADAALAIANIVALQQLTDIATSTAFRDHVVALLSHITLWYHNVRHRVLFVSALKSLCVIIDEDALAWHVHQSVLLFQSAFAFTPRTVQVLLHQLQMASTTSEKLAALRNLTCALGRVKLAKLESSVHQQLLEESHKYLMESPCQDLASDILRVTSPPLHLTEPLVISTLLNTPYHTNPYIAEFLLITQYPLSSLQDQLESSATSDDAIIVILTTLSHMLHLMDSSEYVKAWSDCLGGYFEHPSRHNLAKAFTPSIIMLYDHHPSPRIRQICANLLFRLDLNMIVKHYVEQLPSENANNTLRNLVSCRATTVLPRIIESIQNLRFTEIADTVAPSGIEAPTSKDGAIDRRRIAVNASVRWLAHVSSQDQNAVATLVQNAFFKSPQDSCSMGFLREIYNTFPNAFSNSMPTLLAHIQKHLTTEFDTEKDTVVLIKLRPLLALRMAPLTGYKDDPKLQMLIPMLLKIIYNDDETEDLRKLAADILAKFPAETTIPIVIQHLRPLMPQDLVAALEPWSLLMPTLSSPITDKTMTLMVYSFSCVLANHVVESKSLNAELVLIFGVWSIDDTTTMAVLERVQRGCIECLTILLHHTFVDRSSSVFMDELLQILLDGFFYGQVASNILSSDINLPARLCCCNVLLNITPRLDEVALIAVITRTLPYLLTALQDPDSNVLSASLKLVLTWTKHRGFVLLSADVGLNQVRDIWMATLRLVVVASTAQISMEAVQTVALVVTQTKEMPRLANHEFLRDISRHLKEARDTTPHAQLREVLQSLIGFLG